MSRSLQSQNTPAAKSSPRRGVRNQGWWWKRSRRTRILLSLISLLVGIVILAIPFSPWILYHAFKPEPSLPYASRLAGTSLFPTIAAKEPVIPKDNRLVIPKIGVNVEIVEGQDERALWRGIWHLPQTSTPDKGGNTVLTGHRFQYLAGPRTLYLLDQMQIGDVIIVYWQGKEYDYQVRERRIVNPTAVEILDNTDQPQLTVFTCTPIFSTKQRLVLFADPITT